MTFWKDFEATCYMFLLLHPLNFLLIPHIMDPAMVTKRMITSSFSIVRFPQMDRDDCKKKMDNSDSCLWQNDNMLCHLSKKSYLFHFLFIRNGIHIVWTWSSAPNTTNIIKIGNQKSLLRGFYTRPLLFKNPLESIPIYFPEVKDGYEQEISSIAWSEFISRKSLICL